MKIVFLARIIRAEIQIVKIIRGEERESERRGKDDERGVSNGAGDKKRRDRNINKRSVIEDMVHQESLVLGSKSKEKIGKISFIIYI